MAEHAYLSRGYTSYNEMELLTDDWNKASYGGYGYSDVVYSPLIIEAQVRTQPFISYTSNHNAHRYVSERETVVENKYSSPIPIKVELFNQGKWSRVEENEVARPTRINMGDWHRSSYSLSRPTNDISEAVHFLKEAAAAAPLLTFPKKDNYAEEAARRYARPVRIGETYTRTINHREAIEKYNGTSVPSGDAMYL